MYRERSNDFVWTSLICLPALLLVYERFVPGNPLYAYSIWTTTSYYSYLVYSTGRGRRQNLGTVWAEPKSQLNATSFSSLQIPRQNRHEEEEIDFLLQLSTSKYRKDIDQLKAFQTRHNRRTLPMASSVLPYLIIYPSQCTNLQLCSSLETYNASPNVLDSKQSMLEWETLHVFVNFNIIYTI